MRVNNPFALLTSRQYPHVLYILCSIPKDGTGGKLEGYSEATVVKRMRVDENATSDVNGTLLGKSRDKKRQKSPVRSFFLAAMSKRIRCVAN